MMFFQRFILIVVVFFICNCFFSLDFFNNYPRISHTRVNVIVARYIIIIVIIYTVHILRREVCEGQCLARGQKSEQNISYTIGIIMFFFLLLLHSYIVLYSIINMFIWYTRSFRT